MPIKGPIHNYDPHNFDDFYADEYGGYGIGMNGQRVRRSNDCGYNSGFNRSNIGKDRRRFDFIDPWAHNGENNEGNSSNSGNENVLRLTSLMGPNRFGGYNINNNIKSNMEGKSSTQVTIPKDVRTKIKVFFHRFYNSKKNSWQAQ